MDQEIYNKFKSLDIVPVITVHRLEWLGLVVRMDGDRWMDDAKYELNVDVKRWRTRILDRRE